MRRLSARTSTVIAELESTSLRSPNTMWGSRSPRVCLNMGKRVANDLTLLGIGGGGSSNCRSMLMVSDGKSSLSGT
jgi:hypothetical protein